MAPSGVSAVASPTPLKIGIVGFGSFAQFLAKTILTKGHFIRATSRSDYSQLCSHLGVSFYRDMDAFVESDNDVIVICTSILSLSQVMDSIPFHSLKLPTLFADVLSVKEHPKNLLLQALPSESDILCTHPMFGPESGKDGWKGLTFMYDKVRIRNESLCSTFLHIFASEGCKMLEMACEEHDKLAAKSQLLTHTIGRVLGEMDIEPTPIDTKGFQKLIEVKESSMNDSFDLFAGLFIYNKFSRQQLENLEAAIDKVKQKLHEEMISSQKKDVITTFHVYQPKVESSADNTDRTVP